MVKTKLFFLSFLLTLCGMMTYCYFNPVRRPPGPFTAALPPLTQIASERFATSQLSATDVLPLKLKGMQTIVDIRPDGEEANQTPSAEIERLAKSNGMNFYYIPVPHENIPDSAVTALHDALASQPGPAVLYCHSGRRAVRTFALAEASRADGPDCDSITQMVKAAGFTADDLQDNIKGRIAQRNAQPAEEKR